MSIVAVIPARYDSTRFEGKPLAKATGKYLIQHVYEQVCACDLIDKVIIATDDDRIMRAGREFSADCRMTRTDHVCGSDRIAEVAAELAAEIIINVQGDEPDMAPGVLETLINRMQAEPRVKMATVARHFTAKEDPADPNLVKVVLDDQGYALYFSRSVIPFSRDCPGNVGPAEQYLLHLGIYGYRRDFLLAMAAMEPSALERLEKLEQLRALQAGERIAVNV
ncbi:MAG: 3-deoxy-manno-octulosonate cytidylyltransferase, partial [Phycisphaerae bacterium]|nr:3-deoxy-manno-octulosonate cytidylyltransferase [Phycisphaerae bacterium]